mmetsp:Transcript_73605/g.137554  ORF Transcript_73605/g.137554 Transcript_73605/m.137554 type:complete len:92 (-) Transcript_73605:35-310(-)
MDSPLARGCLKTATFLAATSGTMLLLWFLFRDITEEEQKSEVERWCKKTYRPIFVPSTEWQQVTDDMVCPPGLEYRMDLSGGGKWARLLPK